MYSCLNEEHFLSAFHCQIREITIEREDNSGLGLSIKGGADHQLPPLISKLVPDSPAAKTEQLCVGDAIIQV